MRNQQLTTNQAHDALLLRPDVKSVKIIGRPANTQRAAQVSVVVYRHNLPPVSQTGPTTDDALLGVYMRITFNSLAA